MSLIDMNEIKDDIFKLLERIFMERRVAEDLGLDTNEIDNFIVEEGAKQKERFENITTGEMIKLMIEEITAYNITE